jgi:hypothetical protein
VPHRGVYGGGASGDGEEEAELRVDVQCKGALPSAVNIYPSRTSAEKDLSRLSYVYEFSGSLGLRIVLLSSDVMTCPASIHYNKCLIGAQGLRVPSPDQFLALNNNSTRLQLLDIKNK